jgi:hypothetical protein
MGKSNEAKLDVREAESRANGVKTWSLFGSLAGQKEVQEREPRLSQHARQSRNAKGKTFLDRLARPIPRPNRFARHWTRRLCIPGIRHHLLHFRFIRTHLLQYKYREEEGTIVCLLSVQSRFETHRRHSNGTTNRRHA